MSLRYPTRFKKIENSFKIANRLLKNFGYGHSLNPSLLSTSNQLCLWERPSKGVFSSKVGTCIDETSNFTVSSGFPELKRSVQLLFYKII
jgi:hypothetical protein